MNRYTAMVAGLAAVALVAVTYLVLARGGGTIEAEGPGDTRVTIKGESTPVPKTGRIEGEDLTTGGALNADNKDGGDVAIKRARAEGDINLSTGSQEGATDPK
jgi:hypothetical protein